MTPALRGAQKLPAHHRAGGRVGSAQRQGCRAAATYVPAAGAAAGLPSAAEPTRAASACRWNAARGDAG